MIPFEYRPITEQRRLDLPGGAKAAIWVGVNIEHYRWGVPALSIAQATAEFEPDPLNVAWREYGARVGIFRMIDGLTEIGMPVAAILNASVCDEYPQIIDAVAAAGWTWVAHGWDNSTLQVFLPPDEEPAYITRVTERIESATGQRPRGWLGPFLSSSPSTLDLLAAEGYVYNLDWGCDDTPFDFRVRSGRLVSVPYSVEVNDITAFVLQHQSPEAFVHTIRSHVDQIVREGAERPRVLGVGVHPFLVGQPARFNSFRDLMAELVSCDDVWVTTPDEIAQLYIDQG